MNGAFLGGLEAAGPYVALIRPGSAIDAEGDSPEVVGPIELFRGGCRRERCQRRLVQQRRRIAAPVAHQPDDLAESESESHEARKVLNDTFDDLED